ncbi:MAG: acyltransferase family protein [Actinomycetes bacterium]
MNSSPPPSHSTESDGSNAPTTERFEPPESDVREGFDGTPLLRHIPALDGLRGVAVAGVLLFHAQLLGGGFLGVDLFFVLSGYLITSLLLSERRDTGQIGLKRFWARRARRLLPALGGLLAGVIVYAAVFAAPNQLEQIRADGLATMAYVANWHTIFSKVGYWDLFATPSPLEHMWSLAIEEQFYLIWPFIGFLVLRPGQRKNGTVRKGPRSMFFVSGSMVLASAGLMVGLAGPQTIERVYLGTDTRAAAILLGATLASWLAWKGPARSTRGRVFIHAGGWAGAVVLAVAWVLANGHSLRLYHGGLFLCGLAVAAIIASVAHPKPGWLAIGLSIPPLRFLGVISYGLYLWHWPVFLVLDQQRVGLDGWALFAIRATVSIAIAMVSYYVLERPIRLGAFRGWGIKVATPAIVGALVLGLLITTSGAVHTPTTAETVNAANDSINAATKPADVGKPRIMIAGDSIAFFLGERLDLSQQHFGIISGSAALPGCRFTPGPVRFPDGKVVTDDEWPMCDQLWTDSVAKMKPDVAFLMVNGPGNNDRQVDGVWTHSCEPRFDGYLAKQLNSAIDKLGSSGAIVVIAIAIQRPAGDDLVRLDCFNQVIRNVAASRPRVQTVDADAYVCPNRVCLEQIDGQAIRPDDIHFRDIGADYFLNWLVPELTKISQHS